VGEYDKVNDVNRRNFFAGFGALALTSAKGAVTPARIVDTHTHFYDPSRPQGVPWPPKNDAVLYKTILPEQYRKMVQPLGVTGTVVVEASAWLEDNQWVLDLAKDNPILLGLVGHLDPGTPDFKNHLDRLRKNPKFLGIRVGGGVIAKNVEEPAFISDMKRLADAGLQLDALGGPTMFAPLVRLSGQVPKLRVIIDHLPFDPTNDPSAKAAFVEIGKLPQIYAKVSNVLRRSGDRVPVDLNHYRSVLDEVWNNFGEDRVIYGSNWPVSERVAPYESVLAVVREYFNSKGQRASDKYFWKNAQAFYRWPAK
jgi:predicted TIM-barrel fold metal-dependent hydrolase